MVWDLFQSDQLGRTRPLNDRERVLVKDSPATHAYFLEEGSIEILQENGSGAALVVKILGAPNLFGVIELIGHEPRYLETVRALGPGRIRPLPKAVFLELLRSSPAACYACLENTCQAFCSAARFEPAHLVATEQKLANFLLALFDCGGTPTGAGVRLGLKRNQADFADAIGASERSVSRILALWQEEGLIAKKRGQYELLNRFGLEAIAGELRGSLLFQPKPSGEGR